MCINGIIYECMYLCTRQRYRYRPPPQFHVRYKAQRCNKLRDISTLNLNIVMLTYQHTKQNKHFDLLELITNKYFKCVSMDFSRRAIYV